MEPKRFRQLMAEARRGEDDAVSQLIDEYGEHVQHVIRRRLDRRMRSKFDSTDFTQMVWASWFRCRNRTAELDDPDQLIRFLTTIAKNKLAQEHRKRFRSGAYNLNRETSLEDLPMMLDDDCSEPPDVVMAWEQFHQLSRQLPIGSRRLLWLRMQGATFTEIADQLGLHERTVRRQFKGIIQREQEREQGRE